MWTQCQAKQLTTDQIVEEARRIASPWGSTRLTESLGPQSATWWQEFVPALPWRKLQRSTLSISP